MYLRLEWHFDEGVKFIDGDVDEDVLRDIIQKVHLELVSNQIRDQY